MKVNRKLPHNGLIGTENELALSQLLKDFFTNTFRNRNKWNSNRSQEYRINPPVLRSLTLVGTGISKKFKMLIIIILGGLICFLVLNVEKN